MLDSLKGAQSIKYVRISSKRGGTRRFAYKHTFKPFKNIFTYSTRYMGLYFEIMASATFKNNSERL
jgi:hypothetical protein